MTKADMTYGTYYKMRNGDVTSQTEKSIVKTQFTESEIAELPEWCQHLTREEVTE